MINQLASPSVCVIDNEAEDYCPILDALNGLYVSSVHLTGEIGGLPPKPFGRLQLVFVDLHLTASVGKDAASYTANVFIKTVSSDTAPVIAVIWSKYAKDKVAVEGVPPEDQETEAELFKRTLLEAQPKYNGRVIFIEMAKPRADDRPGDWAERLKAEIQTALRNQQAVDVLWAWDSMVQGGCSHVAAELTDVAQAAIAGTGKTLEEGLKATLQKLAEAQGEGDFTKETAPRHLFGALGSLLADQLEHSGDIAAIADHGVWLCQQPTGPVAAGFAAHINGLLLTAAVNPESGLYVPGTVFRVKLRAGNSGKFMRESLQGFKTAFGERISTLVSLCGRAKRAQQQKWKTWRAAAQPVLVELSPICDVAQGSRVNSFLVAGVVIPASLRGEAKSSGAYGILPADFRLRGSDGQEVTLVYCHRYKVTFPARIAMAWLEPWFRLRDMPTAALRNASAADSARVGYTLLR